MKRLFAFSTVLALLTLWAGACSAQHHAHNIPPAQRLLEPGPMVGGPGPGVLAPAYAGMGGPPAGAYPLGAGTTIQLLFSDANQMDGMQIRWDVGQVGMFDSEPLVVPGRQNFPQGGIYRLKLTNIPNRVGLELYPTIELGNTTPRTEAYLAHNAIPIQFTNEDFDQVESNNFVTKVIYLPAPEFQELAQAGIETLVSTRLDPGIDPITEADRRGAIMAIVRLGNKDVENTGLQAAGSVVRAAHGVVAGGYGGGAGPMAMSGGGNFGGAGNPSAYISGITSPSYGMPYVGTPIGLPGPPHIPLGSPAGLRKHWIKNHTPMYIPRPAPTMGIHVKQNPGYSYPRPANRVRIFEQNIHPPQRYKQPHHNMQQAIPSSSPPMGGIIDGHMAVKRQANSADPNCVDCEQ